MTNAEFTTWAEQQDAAGVKDGFGNPWTTWLLAVRRPDGSVARDTHDHQIFETQADYKLRHRAVPVGQTLDLFA